MTTTETPSTREKALDSTRGWVIVGLGICVLTIVWGAAFTFTIYADRLAAVFTLSAVQVSSIFSIMTVFFLGIGGLFGVIVARFPLRPVLVAVSVSLAATAALMQVVASYIGVIVVFALLGIAGGTAFTIVVSLPPQWFETNQGLATSITMTGVGFGPLVLPFGWLWLLDRVDFRTAFAVITIVAAGVVLLSSFVYRRPPGHSGSSVGVDTAWLRTRLGDSRFLSTAVGFGFAFTWYYVLSSYLVEILTESGIEVSVAAAGLSIVGGVSVFTRVGGGFVGDRIGRRETFLASVSLACLCAFALPFVHSNGVVYITLFGFGVALGPLASLWSPIVLTRFGHENATATVGLLNIATAGVAFLAPLTISVLHGITNGYMLPFLMLGIVTALGALLFGWGTSAENNGPNRSRSSSTD